MSVHARYHRGTQGGEGRGCGKVFFGIAADGGCGRVCSRSSIRPALRLAVDLLGLCAA